MYQPDKARVIKMPTAEEQAKTIFTYAKSKGEELDWDKLINANTPAVISELGSLEEERVDEEAGTPPEKYRDNPGPGENNFKFAVDHYLEMVMDRIKNGENKEDVMQSLLSLVNDLREGQNHEDEIFIGWTPGNFKRLEVMLRQAYNNIEKRPKVYFVGTVEYLAPDPHDMNEEKLFRGSLYKEVGTNQVAGVLSSDSGRYGTSTGVFKNMLGTHVWEVVESVESPDNPDMSITGEYKKV
jgi:hypothetical protein